MNKSIVPIELSALESFFTACPEAAFMCVLLFVHLIVLLVVPGAARLVEMKSEIRHLQITVDNNLGHENELEKEVHTLATQCQRNISETTDSDSLNINISSTTLEQQLRDTLNTLHLLQSTSETDRALWEYKELGFMTQLTTLQNELHEQSVERHARTQVLDEVKQSLVAAEQALIQLETDKSELEEAVRKEMNQLREERNMMLTAVDNTTATAACTAVTVDVGTGMGNVADVGDTISSQTQTLVVEIIAVSVQTEEGIDKTSSVAAAASSSASSSSSSSSSSCQTESSSLMHGHGKEISMQTDPSFVVDVVAASSQTISPAIGTSNSCQTETTIGTSNSCQTETTSGMSSSCQTESIVADIKESSAQTETPETANPSVATTNVGMQTTSSSLSLSAVVTASEGCQTNDLVAHDSVESGVQTEPVKVSTTATMTGLQTDVIKSVFDDRDANDDNIADPMAPPSSSSLVPLSSSSPPSQEQIIVIESLQRELNLLKRRADSQAKDLKRAVREKADLEKALISAAAGAGGGAGAGGASLPSLLYMQGMVDGSRSRRDTNSLRARSSSRQSNSSSLTPRKDNSSNDNNNSTKDCSITSTNPYSDEYDPSLLTTTATTTTTTTTEAVTPSRTPFKSLSTLSSSPGGGDPLLPVLTEPRASFIKGGAGMIQIHELLRNKGLDPNLSLTYLNLS